jgi:hypothetical protein
LGVSEKSKKVFEKIKTFSLTRRAKAHSFPLRRWGTGGAAKPSGSLTSE